jgi:hypothetical protein
MRMSHSDFPAGGADMVLLICVKGGPAWRLREAVRAVYLRRGDIEMK